MLNTTKGDLASKSKAQLVAIFQEASRGLIAAQSEMASKQSFLASIRREIAKRHRVPGR